MFLAPSVTKVVESTTSCAVVLGVKAILVKVAFI